MKTMSVRFSELEQKRLSDLAIKRGGTVSDTVREIIGKYFEDQGKAEADKAEHEKTRARVDDLTEALTVILKGTAEAAANQEKYLKAIYSQVAPKKVA